MKLHSLDDLDRKLIRALQGDCRNLQEIADRLNTPISTLHYRVKRLEKGGVIRGYSALVDPEKTGLIFSGFLHIFVEHGPRFEDLGVQIAEIRGVRRVYWAYGEIDYLAFIRAETQDDFNKIVRRVMNLDGVQRTSTHIIAEVIKESCRVPI